MRHPLYLRQADNGVAHAADQMLKREMLGIRPISQA
jgi:hypothetical protein